MKTALFLQQSQLMNEFEAKFTKQFCIRDSKRIEYICLDDSCIQNWEAAIFCDKCFENHKKKYPKHNHLKFIEAIPNNLIERIDMYLSSDKLDIYPQVLKMIDDSYEHFLKILSDQLHESKHNVKSKIENVWNQQHIVNKIVNLKQNILNDIDNIIESNEDINKSLKEYCHLIQKKLEDFENIIDIANKQLEEIDIFIFNLKATMDELSIIFKNNLNDYIRCPSIQDKHDNNDNNVIYGKTTTSPSRCKRTENFVSLVFPHNSKIMESIKQPISIKIQCLEDITKISEEYNLQSINLFNSNDQKIVHIIKEISSNCTIKELFLDMKDISINNSPHILEQISQCKSLVKLFISFWSTEINDDKLMAFSDLFDNFECLEQLHLNLRYTNITDKSIGKIAQGCLNIKYLKQLHLDLVGCDALTDQSCEKLNVYLSKSTSMRKLQIEIRLCLKISQIGRKVIQELVKHFNKS